MEIVTILSWNDIDECCLRIKNMLESQDISYDVIIGVQRGGLIPGVILSHMLEVSDFYSLGIRTTNKEGNRTRRLSPIVKDAMIPQLDGKNVLVVDDVTNTGLTMQIAVNRIRKKNPQIITSVALVWDGLKSSSCPTDFYARYTPAWVVFPWEDMSDVEDLSLPSVDVGDGLLHQVTRAY